MANVPWFPSVAVLGCISASLLASCMPFPPPCTFTKLCCSSICCCPPLPVDLILLTPVFPHLHAEAPPPLGSIPTSNPFLDCAACPSVGPLLRLLQLKVVIHSTALGVGHNPGNGQEHG